MKDERRKQVSAKQSSLRSQLRLGQTKTIMVMPIFPLLTSSKKGGQAKRSRVFIVTTTWVMEENNLRYTQVYGTLMILAIPVIRKQVTVETRK